MLKSRRKRCYRIKKNPLLGFTFLNVSVSFPWLCIKSWAASPEGDEKKCYWKRWPSNQPSGSSRPVLCQKCFTFWKLVCALNCQIYCCPVAFIDCPYFIISIIMAVRGRVTFVARLTRVNRGHMPEGARQDKGYEDVERDEEHQCNENTVGNVVLCPNISKMTNMCQGCVGHQVQGSDLIQPEKVGLGAF